MAVRGSFCRAADISALPAQVIPAELWAAVMALRWV
nr:MAG TPA: hypothetical protein [Caudoviricetes sp.]